MRLTSCSGADGASIPEPYAAGRRDAASAVAFAGNISPRLAWSDASADDVSAIDAGADRVGHTA